MTAGQLLRERGRRRVIKRKRERASGVILMYMHSLYEFAFCY